MGRGPLLGSADWGDLRPQYYYWFLEPPVRLANIYLSPLHACGTLWALSIMVFQPWFLVPFCAARLLQVVLEATGDGDLESTSLAFVLDLLDEYQSLLLEFLYADLGVVFCLMLLWGAQVLSSWWPQPPNPL